MKNILEGIRVVDMTNNYAGPAAVANMADFGADVIHVEKPVLGDDNRAFAPKMDGKSLGCAAYNRGKKSVVINPKDPEGLAVLKQMIAEADVLAESFRPGVMDKLGLSYEDVKQINPKIIYVSISAFGHTGPYSQRPGYDVIAQAFSGFMHKTGQKNGPPSMTGVALGDSVGAITGFASIMAALFYRERTGLGQHVDVSLARSLMWCNSYFDFINIGVDSKRNGNHNSALSPYGLFEGNNDETIIIAAVSAKVWENLCKAMGREDLISDPRTADVDLRVQNEAFVVGTVTEWVKSYPRIQQVVDILDEAGVPNIKVYNHTDLLNDPHARECGWVVEVPVPDDITSQKTYFSRGVLADFSVSPGDPIHQGPTLGQHNHEVLGKYLSKEKIDELQTKWAAKKK